MGGSYYRCKNTFKKKKNIKSKIEFNISDYGKGRTPSFRDPGERCKNKPVATETCSQHLLLYSQPNKYKYELSINLNQIGDGWSLKSVGIDR